MRSNIESVAHDQIRAFIERIERLEEERSSIAKDIAEVYAEAKGNGFDRKALKIIVTKRRQDPTSRMELEALVELYETALGMRSPDDDEDDNVVPLTRARAPARAHVEIIEEFDAETGEVLNEIPVSHTPEQPGRADPGTPDDAASAGETATVYPGGENANSVGNADASHASLRSGGAEAARLAHNQEVAGASPAPATISDMGNTISTEPDAALRPQMGGHQTLVDEPVTIPRAVVTEAAGSDTARTRAAVTAERPDFTKPNPLCADPDDCGVYASWNMLCGQCKRRAEARQHEAGAVH